MRGRGNVPRGMEDRGRVKGEGLGGAKGWGNYDKIRSCTIKKRFQVVPAKRGGGG